VGDGFESQVYRARSAEAGDVVVRVPRYRWYRLPERPAFSALRNLRQEYEICAALHTAGVPVAEPLRLCVDLPTPVLVSRYVPTERLGAPPAQIGALLAHVHRMPPPITDPVDHDGTDMVSAMSNRTIRRWRRLADRFPQLTPPPEADRLRAALAPAAAPGRLLHMDVRACNILSVAGHIGALVDWSCCMVGHPAADLTRIEEFANLPENGLDAPAILAAYAVAGEPPAVPVEVDTLLRLDAVIMLAALFNDYVPDPQRAAWAMARADELAGLVVHHLRRG
jgi:aminoglycoside phosphotransferase (APT) family kinase protein